MLCNLILNGQVDAMKELTWTPGTNYEVVTISFDPQDTFDVARHKKETTWTPTAAPRRAGISYGLPRQRQETGRGDRVSLPLRRQAAAVSRTLRPSWC